MEWIWIVLLIGISVVNGIRKNKKQQEARKNTPQHSSRPESETRRTFSSDRPSTPTARPSSGTEFPASPKARTRGQMVEEQRRRAQAYQQREGYPVNAPARQPDLPPWKRVAETDRGPAAQRVEPPVVQRVEPPVARRVEPPVAQRIEQPSAVPPVKPKTSRPASAHRPQSPQTQPGTPRRSGQPVTSITTAVGAEPLPLPQSREAWQQAIILSEILAPPKAKRPPVRNRRI